MKYVNSEQFRKDEECIEAWAIRLHAGYTGRIFKYAQSRLVTSQVQDAAEEWAFKCALADGSVNSQWKKAYHEIPCFLQRLEVRLLCKSCLTQRASYVKKALNAASSIADLEPVEELYINSSKYKEDSRVIDEWTLAVSSDYLKVYKKVVSADSMTDELQVARRAHGKAFIYIAQVHSSEPEWKGCIRGIPLFLSRLKRALGKQTPILAAQECFRLDSVSLETELALLPLSKAMSDQLQSAEAPKPPSKPDVSGEARGKKAILQSIAKDAKSHVTVIEALQEENFSKLLAGVAAVVARSEQDHRGCSYPIRKIASYLWECASKSIYDPGYLKAKNSARNSHNTLAVLELTAEAETQLLLENAKAQVVESELWKNCKLDASSSSTAELRLLPVLQKCLVGVSRSWLKLNGTAVILLESRVKACCVELLVRYRTEQQIRGSLKSKSQTWIPTSAMTPADEAEAAASVHWQSRRKPGPDPYADSMVTLDFSHIETAIAADMAENPDYWNLNKDLLGRTDKMIDTGRTSSRSYPDLQQIPKLGADGEYSRVSMKSADLLKTATNQGNLMSLIPTTQAGATNRDLDSNQRAAPFLKVQYIYGVPVDACSEAYLISTIRKVEDEIAGLQAIKTESKKIAGNIAKLQANLDKIVKVLDKKK